MKTWTGTLLAVLLAAGAASAVAPLPAAAQPAASEDAKRAARELADKGYERYEAGDYAKAAQLFRDAAASFPAPTILLLLGHAHLKRDDLVQARAAYQRLAAQELAADAPKEFVDAQAEAKAALPDLSARISTLKITLKGMTPKDVKIFIDDVEVPADDILKPLPQNPGTHKIVGVIGGDEGGRSVYQSVTLKEGTTKQIQLVFRPGGPVNQTPADSGGCASCEVGALGGGSGAPRALLSAMAVGALLAARRRRPR